VLRTYLGRCDRQPGSPAVPGSQSGRTGEEAYPGTRRRRLARIAPPDGWKARVPRSAPRRSKGSGAPPRPRRTPRWRNRRPISPPPASTWRGARSRGRGQPRAPPPPRDWTRSASGRCPVPAGGLCRSPPREPCELLSPGSSRRSRSNREDARAPPTPWRWRPRVPRAPRSRRRRRPPTLALR
jgi:hypothetical protein